MQTYGSRRVPIYEIVIIFLESGCYTTKETSVQFYFITKENIAISIKNIKITYRLLINPILILQ